MTSADTLRYLTQVICERMKEKKEPRFPIIKELFDFIKKYESIELEELKEHLNTLYKEGKIKVRETINSKLIEIL